MNVQLEEIKNFVQTSHKIIVIQAENPDADSLGSALALEHILGDIGKDVILYCAVDMPGYLRYMSGWDRVTNEFPNLFDLSIIVDASTSTLFEKTFNAGHDRALSNKPCIVLDHHNTVENVINFSSVMINEPSRSSAGEVIYHVSTQIGWDIPIEAQEFIMTAILGDTQGLSNDLASAETYRVLAKFVENGVNRPKLEELRREYSKMPQEIYKYKAALITRTSFASDGRIAYVIIPQDEINKYSPLYNPAPLVQNDMLQVTGVDIAVVFKVYKDGKITGAIRCNSNAPYAAEIASQLGGGGHDYASGFKITDGTTMNETTQKFIHIAQQLLIV